MGFLSTHVLDTAQGKPANGVNIRLYAVCESRTLVKSLTTNSDGRTNEELLSVDEFKFGIWELVFNVGNYFSDSDLDCDTPPFLDEITLRFTISRDDHYHVPLLVSPWSYSTYRGS